MEKNHIFDLNVKFGKYHHFSQIALSDEETMQLYRITFGMDAERPVDLEAITTEEFGAPAARPAYSILENYMLKLTTDFQFADWKDALVEYMKTL